MKTLIIGDLHLKSQAYKQEIYEKLDEISSDIDQIILNGDFWDGYEQSFDRFLSSEWSVLFPLLKSKNTIYHPGNHDRLEWLDDRTSQFSVATRNHTEIVIAGKRIHITHGTEISPHKSDMTYQKIPFKKMLMFMRLLEKYTRNEDHEFLVKEFEKKIPKKNLENTKISNRMGQLSQSLNTDILIMSHTHIPYIETDPEFPTYINTGVFDTPYFEYIVIDDTQETITFFEESYEALGRTIPSMLSKSLKLSA